MVEMTIVVVWLRYNNRFPCYLGGKICDDQNRDHVFVFLTNKMVIVMMAVTVVMKLLSKLVTGSATPPPVCHTHPPATAS